jgi:hypothetical protein
MEAAMNEASPTSETFRARAAELGELVKGEHQPDAIRDLQRQERTFTELADNEDWCASNLDKTVHPDTKDESDGPDGPALAEDEEQVLRCLGAAVIMQWNTLPTKLQKELFDNASSMGDLLRTDALKGQIARFLHNHKDDEAAAKT